MINVIVTGANGFIGSTLVNYLLKNGSNVVAIDISFAVSHIPDCPQVVKLETDIDDVEKLKNLIPVAEYDVMYHLAWAGVNGTGKADPTVQLKNIQMGINCVKLCKIFNVRKILCAGTVSEWAVHSLPDLEHISGGMMYGVAKHCAHLLIENYCKTIGQAFVWMQFSNIYGVGNTTGNLVSYTLHELMIGKEATFGPATQPYDFIYIDDLLGALYRLGTCETKKSTYCVGSGSPRLLKEYLLLIGELAGLKEKICIGIRPDDGVKYEFSMFNTDALREDIGEFVTVPFEEGILKTIEWFKLQYK